MLIETATERRDRALRSRPCTFNRRTPSSPLADELLGGTSFETRKGVAIPNS